jgi:hypothetical protein
LSDAKEKCGVIFATPILSHHVSLEYYNSMIKTEWALIERGILHGHIQRGGDPYLSKVRNKLATDFLRQYPNATDLFFVDDDVGWPAHKAIEFIDNTEPVLAGIYPKKSDALDYPVQLIADKSTGMLVERDGFYKAQAVPTGFLRIKRWVLEEMVKISGVFYDTESDERVVEYYNLFEMGVAPDRWWTGEDYAFAKKWIDMGGEVWVDPDIDFSHRGTKKWESNLLQNMQVFRDKALVMKELTDKEAAE